MRNISFLVERGIYVQIFKQNITPNENLLNYSPSLRDYRYDKVESSTTRLLIGPVSSSLTTFRFNFFLLSFSHHRLIYLPSLLLSSHRENSCFDKREHRSRQFFFLRWPLVDFWLGFNSLQAGRSLPSPPVSRHHTPPILRSSNYFSPTSQV